jgi:hypothetical protein
MISLTALADVFFWLGASLVAFVRNWNSRRKNKSSQSSGPPPLCDPHGPTRESLSLTKLLNLANTNYPDGWLTEYFDPETGERKAGSGDTLAQFIVVEVSETFVSEAPASEQLEEARRVLLRGVDYLHHVIQAFDAYEQQPR